MNDERKNDDYRNDDYRNNATYRNQVVNTLQRSQEAYDRTVLLLSGGALVVSFLLPFAPKGVLILSAQTCWVVSLLVLLISHYSSCRACKRAILQLDGYIPQKKNFGGIANTLTKILNLQSGLFCILGFIFFIVDLLTPLVRF